MDIKPDAGEGELNLRPLDPTWVAQGKEVFRDDTFGDESFWTDVLKMNKAIPSAVSPATALSVGLKVDANAILPDIAAAIKNGEIDLNAPQTTLALHKTNAVVGVKG